VPVNTLGRYKIIREIARSNDVVYEAMDTGINRRVALKELLLVPNLNSVQRRERIERFYREARAAGLLSHPNIVTIFEAGEHNGRHFIAMEYLEGQTLRDLLEKEGKLSPDRAGEIAREVCSALSYAHENGVVHRDIKPDNIQILPNGQIKITDFGIARILEEPNLTADGQVFGTPSYMAPEQVAGKPIDSRTDLFSLGIVLFEMLEGRKPFGGDTVVTITYNIMNQDVNIPLTIPPPYDRVIRKALEKDPDLRYSSALKMAADLDPNRVYTYAPSQQSVLSTTIQGAPPAYALGPATAPATSSAPQVPPDPFARLKPGDLSFPRMPARPMLSEDTKYFLKVFFGVLAVCGVIFFFIWAFMTAYQVQAQQPHAGEINQHIQAAQDYSKQQSYQSAIGEYKAALNGTLDPRDQAAIKHNIAVDYLAIGDQFYNANRPDDALNSWNQALETEPHNINALERIAAVYLYRGNQAEQSGDIKSALTWWQKAQSTSPGVPSGQEAGKNIQRVSGGAVPANPLDENE
jgi:serine/threonine protein kinase